MNIRDIGKVPVEDENPAGINLSDDITYDRLQTEMEKLTSLSNAGSVDWTLVKKLGSEIIENKSKNMVVLTWLSIAMIHTDGLKGFIDSLYVMNGAVQGFWEEMYPPKKRMRGRRNAMSWWVDKVDNLFDNLSPIKLPEDGFNAIIAEFKSFDSFLGENLPDAPILRHLIDKFSNLIDVEVKVESVPQKSSADENVVENQPIPVAPKQMNSPIQNKSISIPSPIIYGDNASDIIKQALHVIVEASNAIYKVDGQNSLVFRLNRLTAWADVTELPPSEKNETMIPAPDEQFVDSLKNLHDTSNWEALLGAAESRMSQYLFWLDLSCYSSCALKNMGQEEKGAAIARDTYEYVQKLPGIEKLSFSGGLPFASHATKQWLKDAAASRHSSSSEKSIGDGEQSLVKSQFDEAIKMMNDNQIDVALNMYRENLLRAPSGRLRFLWLSGMCKLITKADKSSFLTNYYEELEKLIEKFHLLEWEPELAVEALATIADCMDDDNEHKKGIVDKIALINPIKAFEYF